MLFTSWGLLSYWLWHRLHFLLINLVKARSWNSWPLILAQWLTERRYSINNESWKEATFKAVRAASSTSSYPLFFDIQVVIFPLWSVPNLIFIWSLIDINFCHPFPFFTKISFSNKYIFHRFYLTLALFILHIICFSSIFKTI